MSRLLAAALVLALVVPTAGADHTVVKAPDAALLTFVGEHEGTGNDVADAGDVNGDGKHDLLIGTSDNSGAENVGRAYVIWGGNRGRITASGLGSRGLEIRSHQPGDLLGQTVSGLGDINGDGRDEFAVAAPWADPAGRTNAGSIFIVFGSGFPEPLVTDHLGSRAVRIDGAAPHEFAGGALAPAGDVDGDDVPDLLVGAPGMGDTELEGGGGGAYLLSGASLTENVDLAALGQRGFAMSSSVPFAQAGWSVSGAGDMNGDGLDDVVVGAPAEFHESTPGRAFVVFGRTDREPVALESLGDSGWTVSSPVLNDATGRAVAGGHDVNGDAMPDVVIGSPRTPDAEGIWDGAAHVVYGKADVDPVTLGSEGTATLQGAGGQSGWSVALAPSSRGVDTADVLIGAPFKRQGRVYQVFGGAIGEGLDLNRMGVRGFRYAGTVDLGRFGNSVVSVGDDVLVGEPEGMDPETGAILPGAAYVMEPTQQNLAHAPPRLDLVSYNAHQKGRPGSHCWETGCVDRAPSVPENARAVGRGDRAVIYMRYPVVPDDFSITVFRELDEFGRPAGEGRSLDVEVKPGRALFRFPRGGDEIYLMVIARWEGEDRGELTEFYRVRLRSPYQPMRYQPRSFLHAGGNVQMWGSGSYGWTNCRFDGRCVGTISDVGVRTEPRSSIDATAGSPAFIRLRTPYRPLGWRLTEHRRLTDSFFPAGAGVKVPFVARPHERDGERISWELRFELPEDAERVFYRLHARWRGHGEIDHDFHVRLR